MKRLLRYLNPIVHLGEKKYSFIFPLLTMLIVTILLEITAYHILGNPDAVGIFAIFTYVALIIYFSFRTGLRGGLMTAIFTVLYYLYIIYTRHHTGQQLLVSLETTASLGLVYLLLAGTIGWLKQRLDRLIEREADVRKRLQAIVQQLPVGVIVTDRNGVIELANKQAEVILGAKIPVGIVVGKEMLVKAYQNDKEVVPSKSLLQTVLLSGRSVVNREYVIERHDGKRIYVDASASIIRNKAGDVIAAASIINDITSQKEMEKRKDDFVNMASHELKTPITSMKLYIDSLLIRIQSLGDEKAIKTIDRVKYQTERLSKLVSDLLDVSRLQTGKLTFNIEKFNIKDLLEETVDELQGATVNKKINYSGKISVNVLADKFRIYQVLTNLITNAIKYSPDASTINVHAKKEDGKIVVSVQDFGIGIVKDQLKKIFDRLYQVEDDTQKIFPGFGMGLYISKEIIKRHKGNIWAMSEKDKGSTFFFSLPISK